MFKTMVTYIKNKILSCVCLDNKYHNNPSKYRDRYENIDYRPLVLLNTNNTKQGDIIQLYVEMTSKPLGDQMD
jgi:hypothetical protein